MTQKIVVSKQGYNASTDTNIDHLVFSSDYNTLKYSLANGSKTLTVNTSAGGYYNVQDEITHGLGYKPFFKVYADWAGYSPVGIFTLEGNHSIFLSVRVDSNKMYFRASGYNSEIVTITGGDLSEKYTDFFNAWNNETLNVLSPGGQCFDVTVGWTNLLGIPHYPSNPSPFPYVNAYQIYTDFGSFQDAYFERITYTVSNSPPQVGDIVVWDSGFPGSGGIGHTGVANGNGSSSNFDCFVQNDPAGHNTYVKNYNYNNVLGWLRPRDQGTTTTITTDTINFTITFKYKIFKNNLNL